MVARVVVLLAQSTEVPQQLQLFCGAAELEAGAAEARRSWQGQGSKPLFAVHLGAQPFRLGKISFQFDAQSITYTP
jgi:hypothetical protein